MQRIVHSLFCLVLAFALILTGPGGAGPAKGAMLVEICAGDAPSLVWIDADGNPIAPGMAHAKCMDCMLFSAPLPHPADGLLAFGPLSVAPGTTLSSPPLTHAIAHLRPSPRGPPVMEPEVGHLWDPRPDAWFVRLLASLLLDNSQVESRAGVTYLRANL